MRIISKFMDVYDLQHSMRDESRIWERKTEVLYVRKQAGEDYGFTTSWRNRDHLTIQFFYFCSEVYPLFGLTYTIDGVTEKLVTFNQEEVIQKGTELDLSLNYEFSGNTFEKRFNKLMSTINEQIPRIQEMFDKFNHPIGLYSWVREALPDEDSTQEVPCHKLIFNPRLMGAIPWQEIDNNLYRIHQRIEQYLSGVIGHFESVPKTVTTSDKDRLLAKGFDAVTSFRRMKRDV